MVLAKAPGATVESGRYPSPVLIVSNHSKVTNDLVSLPLDMQVFTCILYFP
ncbi:hypothetical protein V1283_003010 [Bradyrhizobium sp. AZCC 2262]